MSRGFLIASSERLSMASPPVTGQPFTLACWGNTTDDTADQVLLYLGDTGSTNQLWAVSLHMSVANNPARFRVENGISTPADVDVNGATVNTWHHLIGLETSATSHNVALDATLGTANTGSLTPTSVDEIDIGARNEAGTADQFFGGDLLWAALWDIALDAQDLTHLSDGREPIFVRRESLVFFARLVFDEDQDQISHTALTVTNTPTVSVDAPPTMIRAGCRGRETRLRNRLF